MGNTDASILDRVSNRHAAEKTREMSLRDYLEGCKDKPLMYATAHERLIDAIGEPEVVDTSQDPKLSRIFSNRKIKRYQPFSDFFGMELVIEKIVDFFKFAAQGLEERKQILYLLGPVGGGKSSLIERIKELMEVNPIYVLKADEEISPVYESPLGLFDAAEDGQVFEDEFGISRRYLDTIPSPWAVKRLREFGGDVSKFSVVEIHPSVLHQIAITKVEAGDPNTQDRSDLVGNVDIRKLEFHTQSDPDAYDWSGGLNIATQGLMDFVEMFKADDKVLNPLLTATQEGHYNGTENFGAIPFQGIVAAHSNESEWENFKSNSLNEAFLDRVNLIKVPYTLRYDEEVKIYEKMLNESQLHDAPRTPRTLEMAAKFSVLTRLEEPENSSVESKMKVLNGESLKDEDPQAKSISEYREYASSNEGMSGMSTREAFKVLSKVHNFDADEVGANPVHLLYVLRQHVKEADLPDEEAEYRLNIINEFLADDYAEFIGNQIQRAFAESYEEYGQNLFEKYFEYADHWLQRKEYTDQNLGVSFDRDELNEELEKLEKPAGIANPKDFRNEVVQWFLRYRADNNGTAPSWTELEKMKRIIDERIFSNMEEMLPVVSFDVKRDSEEQEKHEDFVRRMMELGYTRRQVELTVEWWRRYQKNN
jgi:serine protein kinase